MNHTLAIQVIFFGKEGRRSGTALSLSHQRVRVSCEGNCGYSLLWMTTFALLAQAGANGRCFVRGHQTDLCSFVRHTRTLRCFLSGLRLASFHSLTGKLASMPARKHAHTISHVFPFLSLYD